MSPGKKLLYWLLRALARFLDLVLASVTLFVRWGVGGMITFLQVACYATRGLWVGGPGGDNFDLKLHA